MKETFLKIFGLFASLAIIIIFMLFIVYILPTESLVSIFIISFIIIPCGIVGWFMFTYLIFFAIINAFPIFGISLYIVLTIFLPIFLFFM
jgi:hypothetical protein